MRVLKAGFIFILILTAPALAQVSGTVESIGFDSSFRPDCWTSMVITVTPETSKNDTYEIHVRVQDLDRDLPIFSRQITVTGAAEGQNRTDHFRMYFMPPPTDQGLPDARDPGALRDLRERLKVSLHKSTGKKEWICDLPITGTISNVDRFNDSYGTRGRKLIIAVSAGQSRPFFSQSGDSIMGMMEDVEMVTVRPSDLPENVIGYEAVDAIIWSDADPAMLKSTGDDKLRALESYVRRGGRMVISQPFDWQKILAFENLLPVTVLGIEEKDDLQPLRAMALPWPVPAAAVPVLVPRRDSDPLSVVPGPYRFARAVAKPNTVVSEWITWKTPEDVSPYLVRMPFGLGSVTWIAQDLGDPSLFKTRNGWIFVWNRIFDWKNNPILFNNATEYEKRQWENMGANAHVDLGKSLIERWMDLRSKSAWLVTLAVVFFIGYWLLAGPGAFAYLATRRKTHMSWFIFGLCALLATGLTVLIVKLVLRGPPELKHFSVVRIAPGEPAVVTSRMGIYIPRDGEQKIEIKDTAPNEVSTITALPIHPAFLRDVPEQTGGEYTVPIADPSANSSPAISVPYRSTLKKFQATWVGQINGAVQGSGKLADQGQITGILTNGTGQKLRNIYIAYNVPGSDLLAGDYLIYFPSWEPGVSIDLAKEFISLRLGFGTGQDQPDGIKKVKGRIVQDWAPYWIVGLGGSIMETNFDDTGNNYRKSLPMFSFFDRMAPLKRNVTANYSGYRPGGNNDRFEILRRGGRWLDMSQCISAGAMVVLADYEGPLPIPMEVEGDKVTGEGLIFCQYVLPLDRSAVASTTQPTTQP